ncbi:glycosyltransferase family 4 protein [Paenibacillus sp. DMB20]|uniref:glycosyltransferase family 4 protein n=1 Tax=Paenibacillus sp. DMB20 TaxID=1642570 RepID=UPI00062819AF|nr:glycosyltransferase family 4 protein [Paenibacillus sp. DMB20]KKO51010.1 hypothetical protein XI25_28770 [Paenibacillus sp. DMB20]
MKIVMVGPYPPPLGGISVHVKRAAEHLRQNGLDCDVYDESNGSHSAAGVYPLGSYRRFLLRFPLIKGDLFHVHSIRKKFRMVLGFYKLFGKKIVLTVHGGSLIDQIESSNRVVRFVLLRSLRAIDQILCVNEADTEKLLAMGFKRNRVATMPAYIRPVETEGADSGIPAHVADFLEKAEFAITANGYIRFFQGRDLYGADLLVQLLKELNARGLKARVLFALLGAREQSARERQYYLDLRKRIKAYGLEDRFLFYEVHDTELHPLLKKSDLFMRPTLADGYGVSIAEALACGTPAIASDVCRRPEGTILFRTENSEDMLRKVRDVMENYPSYKRQALSLPVPDYISGLLAVYERLGAKKTLKSKLVSGPNGK